ncbi:MAG: hypothetical protein Q8P05_02535 [Candidatus Diapherotrites archaeon]|nr:hypothetical protein [Candidatus Diapherotrites archaeon]MDZ4256894.1 hypothetical protein [archaeon]
MKPTTIGILGLFLVGSLLLAGCAQPEYSVTPPTGGLTTSDPNTVVNSFTSGTGTGANDISTQELEDLQRDLDELDTAVEESSESNI